MSAIALTHAKSEPFEQVNVPVLDGRPVDEGVIVLIFGVVMSAFFGHTSAANAAKVVLERDPSGRALLRGNAAAMAVATLLYVLVVVSFNGALDPEELAGTAGTAIEPLAARAGASI